MGVIRVITEEDAIAFQALRLRALTEEPEAFRSSADDFATTPLAQVASQLHPSEQAFILGAWAPELVGMVGLRREQGAKRRHIATIWGMYVAPEARGQGHSRALMREALARAAVLPDLEQLHLFVVSTNVPAGTLYRSLGFVTYGIERHSLKLGDRYVDEELMVWWRQPIS